MAGAPWRGPARAAPLFESTRLAIQAALEGLGVVICSPGFVRDEAAGGRLVCLAPEPLPTGGCYWLILPAQHVAPGLSVFINWLEADAMAR